MFTMSPTLNRDLIRKLPEAGWNALDAMSGEVPVRPELGHLTPGRRGCKLSRSQEKNLSDSLGVDVVARYVTLRKWRILYDNFDRRAMLRAS
jgi:hypothetical protein